MILAEENHCSQRQTCPSTSLSHTFTHNSHFTDPLLKLSPTEYEIGQYSTVNTKIRLHNTTLDIGVLGYISIL